METDRKGLDAEEKHVDTPTLYRRLAQWEGWTRNYFQDPFKRQSMAFDATWRANVQGLRTQSVPICPMLRVSLALRCRRESKNSGNWS